MNIELMKGEFSAIDTSNYLSYNNEILNGDKIKNLGDIFSKRNVHLGIFIEPFLTFILNGKKQWESRFSINKCAPYNSVLKNDIVLIKKSGGPILGYAEIADVWYFTLDKISFKDIKENYSELLCIEDPSFWESKKYAAFVSLMRLKRVVKIDPIGYKKKDRRGWVVLSKYEKQFNY